MKERPSFPLMRQSDVQSVYHMQMPRWLFSDSRYADMSLEAKVTYVFLLNRFQLSRRNGWVNEQGEVFVIFPRKELARELRVCEQRVTAAFRTLTERRLVWEKRCGRGDANQIYLAAVTPEEDSAYTCAPFVDGEGDPCGSSTAGSEVLGESAPAQESQDRRFSSRENSGSRTADIEVPEPRELRASKKDTSHTELSYEKVSPSVAHTFADGLTDDDAELAGILDTCELHCFAPKTARVFENAVERLYYSDSVRVGNATLPRSRVRAKLRQLDLTVLQAAKQKLHGNLAPVKNSTTYVMSAVLNALASLFR